LEFVMRKSQPRSDDLDRLFQKELQDEEFSRTWAESEPKRALAIKLVRLRTDGNLTQSELAEKAGWHKSYVSRLESASGPMPDLRTIVKYTAACGAAAGLVFGPAERGGVRPSYTVSLSGMSAGREITTRKKGLGRKRAIALHATRKLTEAR
jgi:transcriptional regulator with XRE-family HTH domain